MTSTIQLPNIPVPEPHVCGEDCPPDAVTQRQLTAQDVAKEIQAYLPNPGPFQQHVVFAKADGHTVVVTLDNGQEFILLVAPLPA